MQVRLLGMRILIGTIIAVAFGIAQAQMMQLMDPQKMMASPPFLLQNASVQGELRLSGKQKSEIKKIMEEFTKSTGGGKVASLSEFNEKFTETDRKLLEQLDDTQRKRFSEVRYQVLSMRSLAEPDIQAALALTEEQKLAVQEFEKSERNGYLESAGKGPNGMKSWANGRERREAEYAKMLTAEQATKLKELFGPPFKDAKKIRGG